MSCFRPYLVSMYTHNGLVSLLKSPININGRCISVTSRSSGKATLAKSDHYIRGDAYRVTIWYTLSESEHRTVTQHHSYWKVHRVWESTTSNPFLTHTAIPCGGLSCGRWLGWSNLIKVYPGSVYIISASVVVRRVSAQHNIPALVWFRSADKSAKCACNDLTFWKATISSEECV